MQSDCTRHRTAVIFRDRGVVFPRRIDVTVSEYVRNNINIARFPIQRRAVGGAQFMRRDFFQRRDDFCIFFDEIFHGAHRNSAVLHGKEEGVFVGGDLRVFLLLREVRRESVADLLGKVQNRLISAFPRHDERVIGKVDALVVQADKLGNTDSRTQKEGENGGIAHLRLFVIKCHNLRHHHICEKNV